MLKIGRSVARAACVPSIRSGVAANLQFSPQVVNRAFHCSRPAFGIEEFFDSTNAKEEGVVTGRSWTAADLRRKVSASASASVCQV
jgi:hypothetical protein